jgi:hypothetical protein
MDIIRLNPAHISAFPQGINVTGGNLHFYDDAKVLKMTGIHATQCDSIHQKPLAITSLTTLAGIATEGLTTAEDATRVIEVIGVDGGIQTKGTLSDTYTRYDTAGEANIVKVRLTTMYGSNTWIQGSEWRLILNIDSGDGITGLFTIIMPPFTLLHYSTLELYVTIDGATYLSKVVNGFDYSMSGTSVATEDFVNDEAAGDDVVVEVASTTGFYVGNQVNVSDSENNEMCRIKAIVTDTSITIDTLTNSYTTANGAKFDQIDYIRSTIIHPIKRGMLKTRQFQTDENSGLYYQTNIGHEVDDESEVGIYIQYVGTESNPDQHVVKCETHYWLGGVGESCAESIQYESIQYVDLIPSYSDLVPGVVTPYVWVKKLASISPEEYKNKGMLTVQIIRSGADAGDTYTGDIEFIAALLFVTTNKLGSEKVDPSLLFS